MKAWDIIKRVCQLPSVEVISMRVVLKLHHNDYVEVEWADKVSGHSLRPRSFSVDYSQSTLNQYGRNKLLVDIFEVLKDEPDTETKEAELNKPTEVAP